MAKENEDKKDKKGNEEKTEDKKGEYEEKNVSVKGVRDDLYKRVVNLARETGATIGELTNQAYKALLGSVEVARDVSVSLVDGARKSMIQTVGNMGELEITGEEIKQMEKKVAFRNIKNLTITDISDKDFVSMVHSIHSVNVLTIPKDLKKSTVLPKCSFVDKLVQE